MPETCDKSEPKGVIKHIDRVRPFRARQIQNMVTGGEDRGSAVFVAGYHRDETGELCFGANPCYRNFIKVLSDPSFRAREPVEGGVVIARGVGVAGMVEFLNKCDQVDELELIKLVEEELRGLLKQFPDEGHRHKGLLARSAPSPMAKGGTPLSAYRATRYFSKTCG